MQRIKGISEYRKSLRDIVIEASMKAFALHGVRAVKMDDVAQSLSISKRTIYEMFGNKEQLLIEVLKTYKAKKEKDPEKRKHFLKKAAEYQAKADACGPSVKASQVFPKMPKSMFKY
jgi:AcrR family transcriptional regulator